MVRRNPESGHVLVLAIVLITLVGLAVQALHTHLQGRHDAVLQDAETAQALALVDAAMAARLARMTADPVFSGPLQQRLGSGVAASRVASRGPREVEVHAEGRLGSRRAHLVALVELTPTGPRVVSWQRGAAR